MNSEMDYELEDHLDYLTDDPDDLPEIVTLTPAQIDQALSLSQRIAEPGHQWAVYLNALTLGGFRQWLAGRTVNFNLDETCCVILEPEIADGISAVCHLQAGDFRLCLIATEPGLEDAVLLPKITVDRGDFVAHFYLPIVVYEEQSAIGLLGFIQQSSLMSYCGLQQRQQLPYDAYQVPVRLFDSNLDNLLLYLNCLNPQTIALAQPTTSKSGQRIHQVLVQPVVNTARWFQSGLQTQVEPISQLIHWIMIPHQPFAMRELPAPMEWRGNPIEFLLDSLRQSDHQTIAIPANARAAYHCFSLGDVELQLYAIVTLLESRDAEAEWSLLLILKQQSARPLPDGLTLEVRDLQTMHIVQHLQVASNAECLFTEAIGTLTEQFLVTIALASGVAITLPTLQFQPAEP